MHNYQHLLQRIETEAKDELIYFDQLDPQYFTTSELYRLLGQWEVKDKYFQQIQDLILYAVASLPFWLIATFIFNSLIWSKLAIVSITLFYLAVITFLVGYYIMNVTLKGNKHLVEVGEKLKAELRRRQQ